MELVLSERFARLEAELEEMRQRKLQVEAEIARQVQAIGEGQPSQSLMAAIGERERELRTITGRLLEPKPDSLRSTLDDLQAFAVSRLSSLRKLIAHPDSVDQAREALAKHFGKFTLEPVTRDGKGTYLAHGRVDFFGDETMARTGGAGGPARMFQPKDRLPH